jgi:hypothetical protein
MVIPLPKSSSKKWNLNLTPQKTESECNQYPISISQFCVALKWNSISRMELELILELELELELIFPGETSS